MFEDYEGDEVYGTEFGERYKDERVPCGRKMLKLDNLIRPFYAGKTYFKDGTQSPDYFDARDYPQVSPLSRILYKKVYVIYGGIQVFFISNSNFELSVRVALL